MTYYLDTSALVKVYHRESGTPRMRELYDGADRIQISELARLEFISTAARKLRAGQLDQDSYRSLLERFEDDIRTSFEPVYFSSLVSHEAARLLAILGQRTPLRTLDAIQFAFYSTCCDEDTVFVCADHRLLAAVEGEGHRTLNPVTP